MESKWDGYFYSDTTEWTTEIDYFSTNEENKLKNTMNIIKMLDTLKMLLKYERESYVKSKVNN